METVLASVLFVAAAIGLAATAVQLLSYRRHLRGAAPRPRARPGISIMKPLCGVDDELAENLESFATLDYPEFEVLLGVADRADRAWPIAQAAARRWPDRVRVVVQRGEPGLNPKVNQLITLAAEARYDILVVSDSNVRAHASYLDDIAAGFDDPDVGLVTHPIVGAGGLRLGSVLDNLHLCGQVAPGVAAAKRVGGKDIVVGKSMALRRADVEALGGFASVKDVLAEDYVLGLRVVGELGKRVVLARHPIVNFSRGRGVTEFYDRYVRWSIIHRKSVRPVTYLGEALLNPIFLACLAALARPSGTTLALFVGVTIAKTVLDRIATAAAGVVLRRGALLAVPLKDLLVGLAWTRGLVSSTVAWRGNRLRVLRGTRLTLPGAPAEVAVAER